MRIEVICTGDEVLTGKTINTNFSAISQKLEDVGLAVQWETTVGDDRDNLLLAFQLAGARSDAVIVNGGLGPTVDDLSQEIAAKAAGVELVLDEDWVVRMAEYFRARGRVMPPNNRKQALLPAGAERIDNPIGTAGGFAVDIGKARFMFTPAVARAAAHAGRAAHPAPAGQGWGAEDHLPQALPLLRIGRVAGGCDAGGCRSARARRQRRRLPRALPAARNQARAAGQGHGRSAKQAGAGRGEVRAAGQFILAEDDQTLAATCCRRGSAACVAGTGGDLHRRSDRGTPAPLPEAGQVFTRAMVALNPPSSTHARRDIRTPRHWPRPRVLAPVPRMPWRCWSISTRVRTACARRHHPSRHRYRAGRGVTPQPPGGWARVAAPGCVEMGLIACAVIWPACHRRAHRFREDDERRR